MLKAHSAAVDLPAADDLIGFLGAVPVGVSLLRRSWPLSRGMWHPMCFLLLAAILGISSGCSAYEI